MLNTPIFTDLERGEKNEEIKISFSNIIRATQRAIKAILIWLTLVSFILVVQMILSSVMSLWKTRKRRNQEKRERRKELEG